MGTVVCTLEEHGTAGRLTGKETVIPMYLADAVMHLKYIRKAGTINRNIEIIKCRSSRHSSKSHEYRIMKGLGMVIKRSKIPRKITKNMPSKLVAEIKKRKEHLPKEVYLRIIEAFKGLDDYDIKGLDPEEILLNILEDYSEID